jgi:uncharacterized damage-inducible protein DinB
MTTPSTPLPEVWLRGPVDGVPAPLQPVAHALLQASEEIERIMRDFPDEKLWDRPHGVASAGFHLQHIAGVLDRMTTYARGEGLSEAQFSALKAEGTPYGSTTTGALVNAMQERVRTTVDVLRTVGEETLAQPRTVGRSGLPSTVLGLLVHGAEHTMRHLGQLLVTVRVVRSA